MKIAIFGLGRMGMQIAKRLHQNTHASDASGAGAGQAFEVIAWNRSKGPRDEFAKFGGKVTSDIETASNFFESEQKVFWVMLPNKVTHEFIFGDEGLKKHLLPGDIVIDGGNSFYKDSMAVAEKLKGLGVYFYDCGTSGGVWGLERGFAIMVGGPSEKWPIVEPIFKTLSSGDNYALLGKNGAGHFVKMVHNGIEYGMMEAIAEGYAVIQASEFKPNLAEVSKVYQKGSVVSSWLIDLTKNIFEHEDVSTTDGFIDATGEGEWTINTAKELGVDVRVIEDSFKVRQESSLPENKDKFSNKIVALLRKQFGGHAIRKKE